MFKTLLSTLNIIRSFWSTGLASELEYKFNFYFEIIAVIGNLIGSLFVLSLFYSPGATLGGWTWSNALIVLGIHTFLDGITISILQPNLSRIVRHVQLGTLDFVLLKPIDAQLWVSLRMFSPWGIPSMITGFLLIIYSLISSTYALRVSTLIVGILMLTCSFLILYSLWFLIASTSIWFVKVWNATEVLRSLLVAGRYPVSAYSAPLRTIFTFVLPVAFLTTVPAEAILGTSTGIMILSSVSISIVFFVISRYFWRYALRFYTSASS